MAKHIKANGTVTDVAPVNGQTFTLKEMQTFVGGYIEIIGSNAPEFVLVINEEGKIHGLPLNAVASSMASESYLLGAQQIVGDVLIGTREEFGFNSDE